jgi:predicted Zn-dependent protease
MIFGPNTAEGVLVGNAFYHPDLGFALQFPRGWDVANRPDQLIAINPRRTARIQIVTAPVTAGMTARELLAQRGISSLGAPERLEGDGVEGVTGIAKVATDGGSRTIRIGALILGSHGYIVSGIARTVEQQGQFDDTFKKVAKSFHRLTDRERARARGKRLRVVTLRGTISWAALARSSPLEKLPETQLRLLNAAPDGTSGPTTRRIKVVE